MVVANGLLAQGPKNQSDTITVRTAYTWSLFKFTDDVHGGGVGTQKFLVAKDGNRVPGAPRAPTCRGNTAMTIRRDFLSRRILNGSSAGYYVDSLNTAKNSAYFIANLKAGYNYSKNLSIFAEGRNLSDQTYAGAVVVNDSLGRYFNPRSRDQWVWWSRMEILMGSGCTQ